MKMVISGKAYEAAIAGSSVPADEHWPIPKYHRRGVGGQYVYEVSESDRELIVGHLQTVAECLLGSSDPDATIDRRAILKVLS